MRVMTETSDVTFGASGARLKEFWELIRPQLEIRERYYRMPTPIDTTKVYSNGHKTMGAMEALGLQQTLKKERDKAEYFAANKEIMVRKRNPLTGEATPREGEGEPIINPEWEDYPMPEKKQLSGKIGVKEERYAILGNSPSKMGNNLEPERTRSII